jgi:glycosyltransferase involved in cell wall biosynthesis
VSELRALFLVEDLASASARTRALDLVAPLVPLGVRAEVVPLDRGRAGAIARAESFDVVVLGRKLLGGGALAALRRSSRALVFDLDDALPERPTDAASRGRSFTRPRRFAEAIRAADLVTVGSAHLRDVILARGPARVRVLPPAVAVPPEVRLDRSPGDGRGGPVDLVWTGSRATLGYLERIRPALAELARSRPRARLTVIADREPAPLGIETRFVAWSLEAERAALLEADVGLMPLAQDAWSLGKCGLKLALYLAHGVPAISSRWGGGGELGDGAAILADDDGEWLRALESLVESPALRRLVATRGRAHAAARLSLEARAPSWAAALREAVAMGRAR